MSAALDDVLEGTDEKTLEALSQVAEAAERYEDMVKIMDTLVQKKIADKAELSADQRNLLSVAYKNVVGVKRSSLRMLNNENQFEDAELVRKYRKRVEEELEDTCTNILAVIEKLADQNKDRLDSEQDAVNKTKLEECQVFYLKMIGDYYRYLTEVFPTDTYKENCNKNYDAAMKIAVEALDSTHPTLLGLALNYSVCHYEILGQPKEACDLAKKAFDDAIEKLDSLGDGRYRDSTLIMQLLRDNLTIWKQDVEDPPADQ